MQKSNKIIQKYCAFCGSKLKPGARFCSECGKGVFIPEKGKATVANGVTEYEVATQTKRFLNFIFDYVGYLVFVYLFSLLVGFISVVYEFEYIYQEGTTEYDFIFSIIAIVAFFLYYIMFEGTWGITPGKKITGTWVLDNEGNKLSYKTAFFRTLARLIPFEPFSYFSPRPLGWHDRISKTQVVQKVKR